MVPGLLLTYLRRAFERLCRLVLGSEQSTFDYRRIFESLGEGLLILNPETLRIEEANPAMAEMAGYERSDLVGAPLPGFLLDEGRYTGERAAEVIGDALEEGMRRVEWKVPRKDGSVFWAEVTVRAVELGPGTRIVAFCRDVTRRKEAEEEKEIITRQKADRERLEELSRQLVDLQEEERRRIAIELHDEIGQTLTALTMALDVDAASLAPEDRERLDEARALIDDLAERVRMMTLDLRPSQLDDLGLVPALHAFLKRFRQTTGVEVQFHHGGVESAALSGRVLTSAYRIVQESLTNVARHANVDRARVNVWVENEHLELRIRDEGTGFEPDVVGRDVGTRGLAGMRERVGLLGGVMDVESAPGEGTRISVRLPLAVHTHGLSAHS